MERSKTKSSNGDKRPKVKLEKDFPSENGGNSRAARADRNDTPKRVVKREPEFEEDSKAKVKLVKPKKEINEVDKKVVTTVKSKKTVFEDDKSKVISVSSKKKTVVKERERKSFVLPGQRHEPLEERDGLRVFYESLYRQRPESEMAQIWMMEYGMLEHDEAQQIFDKVRQKKAGLVSYPKSVTPVKNERSSNGSTLKKPVTTGKKVSEIKKARKSSETNGRGPKRKLVDDYTSDEEEVIPKKKKRG